MSAQHADQYGVNPLEKTCLGPARQAAAQGRTAGLVFRGGQAAPGRAFAQKPTQGGQHPDRRCGRVAAPAIAGSLGGVDHRSDEMKKPEVQCCCPRLAPRHG